MDEEKREYKRRGQSTIDLSLELETRKKLDAAARAMLADIEREAAAGWRPDKAQDVKFSRWFIVELMKKIREKWYGDFAELAKDLTAVMMGRADSRTRKQILMKLKEFGYNIEPPKEPMKDPETVDATRNIIKTIPMILAARAQAVLATSFERGETVEEMRARLHPLGEVAALKSEEIARATLNNVTQKMAIANARACGVRKARWIHVPGVYSSRHTHIEFDRKIFNLDEGLYDRDVKKWVKPGELKYCACQFQIIAPGFEDNGD